MAAHSSSTGKLNIACDSDGDPMKSREDVSGSYQSPTTITSHFSRGRKINQRARSFVVVVAAGVVLLVVVSHCKRREIAGRGGRKTRPGESTKVRKIHFLPDRVSPTSYFHN